MDADRQHVLELAAEYANVRGPAVLEMTRRALGTDKANGYTTSEQADALARIVGLRSGQRLLDLGSGRGWPGGRLALGSGGVLVCADLTFEASVAARGALASPDLGAATCVLVASGTHLPFPDATFDAATHTDVLC